MQVRLKPLFDRWSRERAVQRDVQTITRSNIFDADFYRSPMDDPQASQLHLIQQYLHDSFARRANRPQERILRRPVVGFNPLIYAAATRDFDFGGFEDPLGHFIRHGRPQGSWTHRVIEPVHDVQSGSKQKIAVHAHLHYVELVHDLLFALRSNGVPFDLFLTTTSAAKTKELAAFCRYHEVRPKLLAAVPNKGRNIWPLMDLLGQGAFASYDLVLHVHGKRSPGYDLGDMWRRFLWAHLIGGRAPSMALICAAFASEPNLGLVFAEEPYLDGWEANLPMCTALAKVMRIPTPLPDHFEYPQGAMFWFRPAALTPLQEAGITFEQIPAEPLADDDGTILHAIERMIPFVVERAGYEMATVFIRGFTR